MKANKQDHYSKIAKEQGFKSKEEYFFSRWCQEAMDEGYIAEFRYQGHTWVLAHKPNWDILDIGGRKIRPVQKHSYTIDWTLALTSVQEEFWGNYLPSMGRNTKNCEMVSGEVENADEATYNLIHIDTKGGFSKWDTKETEFKLNRKWMLSRYGIYINKIVPQGDTGKSNGFFHKTWVPKEAYFTPARGDVVARYKNSLTIGDFIAKYGRPD
jgi:hypothetical protein